MVKNTTGGNKHKKHKNKTPFKVESKIVLAGQNQVYALVSRIMGGKHAAVICSDGETRMCIIEGKHYKRVWIRPNDIILCNVETMGAKKNCYMVLKYSLEHISLLRNQRLLNFLDKEQLELQEENENDEEDITDEEETQNEKNYYDVNGLEPKTMVANLNNSSGSDNSDDDSTTGDYNYKDDHDESDDEIYCL